MACPAANPFILLFRMNQGYTQFIDAFSIASSYMHSLLQRVSPSYNLHYRQTFRSSHT